MKNLLLHAGFGKTGTSSIQEFLSRNATLLSQHNYRYISPLGLGNNHTYPILKVIKTKDTHLINFCERVERNSTITPESYINDFKAELNSNNDQIHILSSEAISNLNASDLFNLKNFLYDIYDSISIVMCIRNPIDLLLSYNYQSFREGVNYDELNKYPIVFLQSTAIKLIKSIFHENFVRYNFFNYNKSGLILEFLDKSMGIDKDKVSLIELNLNENLATSTLWEKLCSELSLDPSKPFHLKQNATQVLNAASFLDLHILKNELSININNEID